MKEIVIKSREMIVVQPNERYSVPDEIADLLIARGRAELVEPAIVEKEKKAKGGK